LQLPPHKNNPGGDYQVENEHNSGNHNRQQYTPDDLQFLPSGRIRIGLDQGFGHDIAWSLSSEVLVGIL
jgi:hypothetical protein